MISRLISLFTFFSAVLLSSTASFASDSISVSPTSVELNAGKQATARVANASGAVTATSSQPKIATAAYASGQVVIKGIASGSAIVTVKDSRSSIGPEQSERSDADELATERVAQDAKEKYR